MDIKIIKLTKDDLQILEDIIKLFGDVFRLKEITIPDSKYLAKLLNNDNFISFAALLDNEVVGGLTAFILNQYISNKSMAYIYDLAVTVQYQRKGIGKKLIEYVKEYCQENGLIEMFVQADKSDENAIKFYRATNPSSELEAIQFNYIVKKKHST